MGWNRKEGREHKDLQKGGKLGQRVGDPSVSKSPHILWYLCCVLPLLSHQDQRTTIKTIDSRSAMRGKYLEHHRRNNQTGSYLGWQQKIRYIYIYITTDILVGPCAKVPKLQTKRVQKKTFLAGGPELISICFWDGQLKNRLKQVRQHHLFS